MSEEKKRFPWWLLMCAVVMVLLGAVVSFIETVGRQGTIIGRAERVKDGMSVEQVRFIMDPGRGGLQPTSGGSGALDAAIARRPPGGAGHCGFDQPQLRPPDA